MIRTAVGSVALAAIVAALLTLVSASDPPVVPDPPQAVRDLKGDFGPPPEFGERWATAVAASPAIIAPTDPPVITMPTGPALLPTRPPPVVHRDVCTAHGLRRQFFKRKRWTYWRCI